MNRYARYKGLQILNNFSIYAYNSRYSTPRRSWLFQIRYFLYFLSRSRRQRRAFKNCLSKTNILIWKINFTFLKKRDNWFVATLLLSAMWISPRLQSVTPFGYYATLISPTTAGLHEKSWLYEGIFYNILWSYIYRKDSLKYQTHW